MGVSTSLDTNGEGARIQLAGISGRFSRQPRNAPSHAASSSGGARRLIRSEEHTSELQSLMRSSYAVFCLKKKTTPRPTCTPGNITRVRAHHLLTSSHDSSSCNTQIYIRHL